MEKLLTLMVESVMKTIKSISILIATILVLGLTEHTVRAFSFYSVSSQKFDSSLIELTSQEYSQPDKIFVTQIGTKAKSLTRDPAKWVKSLFYYSITRLNLKDIPYTYLIDEDGLVYQGKSGYIGADIGINDAKGVIMIGYLSNNAVMTNRAEESLKEIVDEIGANWGISKIEAVTLDISKNDNGLPTISYSTSTDEFADSIHGLFDEWTGYEKSNLKYKAEIQNLQYEKDIEVLKRTKIKLSVKNMNDFVWFTDIDPIYIATANGKDSNFAINQVWESFSRPTSISGKAILPGETVDVEFEMEAKVQVGEAKESFVLLKYNDEPFEGSNFDVILNVVSGNSTLVKVTSPQYGFVNVRECQWYSCKVLDTINDGTVLILLEEKDGWSRVKFSADAEGWIASRYLKKI